MIICDDDIRYCQNAFGCLPVADIVKRRTCKFLQKFDVAANVICQACTRRWYSIYFCHCLFKRFFLSFSYCLPVSGEIKLYMYNATKRRLTVPGIDGVTTVSWHGSLNPASDLHGPRGTNIQHQRNYWPIEQNSLDGKKVGHVISAGHITSYT